MKALIILSGGMDSAAALYFARDNYNETEALNFYYGSKHNDREFESAKMICEKAGVKLTHICLDFIGNLFKSDLLKNGGNIPEGHYADESMKRTVVPFRNGIMLSIAAGYAESIGAKDIIIGNHAGDHAIYPDCRSNFISAMNNATQSGTYEGVKIVSPFCNRTKADIVKYGIDMGVPFELTYSCYNGREEHCGKCGTCVERKEAFELANYNDPTIYEA